MLEWIISASVLIIMVMLSRKLLNGKVSCRVQYSLWLLVAVRLLVPISPLESVLSIGNLLPEHWVEQEGMPDAPKAAVPVSNMDRVYSQSVDDGHFQAKYMDFPENKRDSVPQDNRYGEMSGTRIWTVIGTTWLAGFWLLALWLSVVNGIFRFRVYRHCLPFKVPEKLQRQLQWGFRPGVYDGKAARTVRRRPLPVYVTDEISTPCMYGLLRPAIYITPQAAEDNRLLAMVLCHERMHYRHGDHIWSVVRMLCFCLHWYNPLVWAAVGLSRQDGELACDEGVLRQLGEENRRGYGEALLTLSTKQSPTLRSSLNLATSMSDTRKQLKKRLSALVTTPQMAAGTAVLVILLSLGLVVCTFTSRAEDHEENPVSDEAASSMQEDAGSGGLDSQGLGIMDNDSPDRQSQEMAGANSPNQGVGDSDSQDNLSREAAGIDSQGPELTEDGRLYPISSAHEEWQQENVSAETEETRAVYANWNAETLEYYDAERRPVAEVMEGETVTKLTYVETGWSLPATEIQFSREILYWACQALKELEQWTGTRITEACYSISEFGDFNFAQTPADIIHDRIYYGRCYNAVTGLRNVAIESIGYSTDMDLWYSPVKQYTVPTGYDRMTTEEILTWYFERSAIARGSRVEEITNPRQDAYVIRTDQDTYYEFSVTDEMKTMGKGLSLYGPYDNYPMH